MNADRVSVITAAVVAAGPADDTWSTRVADLAARITAMTMDGSDLVATLDGIRASKRFVAVITAVEREESSTRAVVTLKTAPSEFHPDGIEQARSERTDRPDGLAMARKLRQLIGHRVLLWIEVQNGGAKKYRVVRHVEDLGGAE